MILSAGRLIAGGLLLFGLTAPANAAVGAGYSLLSFKPYLERGYNTHLGWQGQPVTATDPHLYFHARETLKLTAELEYLHAGGLIHTQILKVYAPAAGLGAAQWRELEYFALEASGGRLGTTALHALAEPACQGKEWQQGKVFLTLMSERAATWLRISIRGSGAARPLAGCLPKPQKPGR